MSLRLRVRYQVRSIAQFFASLRIPSVLTGTGAKVTIMGLVLLLAVGYIVEMSRLTTSGYEIAELEKKVASLTEESDKLSTEVASHQSIASIQKRLQGVAMVPAKNIRYIKVSDMAVAAR